MPNTWTNQTTSGVTAPVAVEKTKQLSSFIHQETKINTKSWRHKQNDFVLVRQERTTVLYVRNVSGMPSAEMNLTEFVVDSVTESATL